MQLFKCYVPRKDYLKAKDLRDIILTKFYKRCWKENPDLSLGQIERKLAEHIRKQYDESEGTKTIIELLTEFNKQLTKEGY